MKPEPTLKRIDASDMPEDIALAWEASMALRGDATFFEVFANHPDLYRWYVGSFYGEVFRGSTVACLRVVFCRYAQRRHPLCSFSRAFDDTRSGRGDTIQHY